MLELIWLCSKFLRSTDGVQQSGVWQIKENALDRAHATPTAKSPTQQKHDLSHRGSSSRSWKFPATKRRLETDKDDGPDVCDPLPWQALPLLDSDFDYLYPMPCENGFHQDNTDTLKRKTENYKCSAYIGENRPDFEKHDPRRYGAYHLSLNYYGNNSFSISEMQNYVMAPGVNSPQGPIPQKLRYRNHSNPL